MTARSCWFKSSRVHQCSCGGMVDAPVSGTGDRKVVLVRVQSRAPIWHHGDMQVRIQWSPDPDDLGYDADGNPRSRVIEITDDVLVVWVDQFGTVQWTASGCMNTDEVDEVVQEMPIYLTAPDS